MIIQMRATLKATGTDPRGRESCVHSAPVIPEFLHCNSLKPTFFLLHTNICSLSQGHEVLTLQQYQVLVAGKLHADVAGAPESRETL